MRVSSRCYQQIHDPTPRLPSLVHCAGGKHAVAFRHRLVDRQCVETTLQAGESGKAVGPNVWILGNQNTEAQLREAEHTDSQLAR